MINISGNLRRYMNVTWFNINRSSMNISRIRNLQSIGRGYLSTDVSVDQLKREKQAFQALLPEIIDSQVSKTKLKNIPEISSWLKKLLEYNLTGGKCTRGITTVLTFVMLEKPQNITDESLKLARVLGWCAEILQSYFVTQDDIIDNASLRRGVPCWYRLPNVGLDAINDGFLIYCSMLQILKDHFGNTPHYGKLVDLCNETIWYTSIGQHLDLKIPKRKDYSLYTIDNYNAIVKYKTAYYTYKLPIALGLHLVEQVDEQNLSTLEDICIKLGSFFQMQDDYIDCYGDKSMTGKIATDIRQRKCTWLAVTALQHCSSAQRNVFTACYGSEEPAHIERVKRLYDQLQLPLIYMQRENEIYKQIIKNIHDLRCNSMRKLYLKLLDITYKRTH